MSFLSLWRWLKPLQGQGVISRRRHRGHDRTRRGRFVPRIEALEDRTVPSTLTVTNNLDTGVAGDGSLRGEIAAAASGDTINFDPSLAHQTITLTSGELAISKSLDIEGPGADQLTVSGNNASRLFDISSGVTATIAGMTMTDGLANGSAPVLPSAGGAILNFGSLTLANDVLSDNQALGDASKSPLGRPGGAAGGAVANLGAANLIVSNSAFLSNLALGADGSSGTQAGNALGGAITNFATASITNSQLTGNVAQAGSHESGDRDAIGAGGAVLSQRGTLTVTGSTFSHNQAIGGNDSSGAVRPGLGRGGAIASGGPTGAATLVVSASTFDHNQAIGGNGNQSSNPAPSLLGPNDAFGGAIDLAGGPAAISDCTLEHNAAIAGAGGAGQNGGLAVGGASSVVNTFALPVLSVSFSNCTVDHNAAIGGQGGSGGNGGDAWGGGLANLLGATLTVSACTLSGNQATGGDGGDGASSGNGFGGGIYNDGRSILTISGTTITNNQATGGEAGDGGSDGQGIGGGVYFAAGGVVCLDLFTSMNITGNRASTSNNDVFGVFTIC
jgi:hypothetical protein